MNEGIQKAFCEVLKSDFRELHLFRVPSSFEAISREVARKPVLESG